MAYLDFERNPDLEDEFFLAAELGMTVDTLRTGVAGPLTQAEFVRWQVYYGRKSQRIELFRG